MGGRAKRRMMRAAGKVGERLGPCTDRAEQMATTPSLSAGSRRRASHGPQEKAAGWRAITTPRSACAPCLPCPALICPPQSPNNPGMPMAARQFIYHMRGLAKTYPAGKKVLDNINLSFYPDAKIGVLGVNGSGKSTLMRIMAGLDTEFVGEGFVAEGSKVGYLPQEPDLDPALDVKGNAMLGVKEKQAILDQYNELAMNYSDETADEMTRLQDEIEAKGLWDLESQVEQAMDALGCPPDDADITKLSGGEPRRVALCRLLLEKPELLLLDEPTNHLDAETVNWLEGHLRAYPGAILIVTHDRYFLDNVTGWILELDRGKGIPYEGNYTNWLKQKQKRLSQESSEDKARARALEAESEWIAASPKARQAKSKARIQRYEELVAKSAEKA